MKRCTYTLSAEERALAEEIARKRDVFHKTLGHEHRAHFEAPLAHLKGTACELAASKKFGLPWNVPFTERMSQARAKPDVGGLQIRHGLSIRPGDDPAGRFVFAFFDQYANEVEFLGWMVASEAMREEWYEHTPRNGGDPYWRVPLRALNPIETLLP